MKLDALLRSVLPRRELDILEIGVIRSIEPSYEDGDGWSTVTFARHVAQYGGSLTGVDLEVGAARAVLAEYDLSGTMVRSDAMTALKAIEAQGNDYDVIYLDDDNPADIVLEEFFIARRVIRPGGLIIANDMNLDDPEVTKGHDLIPYLKTSKIPYRILKRHTSWCTRDVLVLRAP